MDTIKNYLFNDINMVQKNHTTHTHTSFTVQAMVTRENKLYLYKTIENFNHTMLNIEKQIAIHVPQMHVYVYVHAHNPHLILWISSLLSNNLFSRGLGENGLLAYIESFRFFISSIQTSFNLTGKSQTLQYKISFG